MMSRIVQKVRSIMGETLVESLVSMLVITMVFAFLVTAIVTAAKINDSVKAEDVSVDLSRATFVKSVSVQIGDKVMTRDLYVVEGEGDKTGYYYYEAPSS